MEAESYLHPYPLFVVISILSLHGLFPSPGLVSYYLPTILIVLWATTRVRITSFSKCAPSELSFTGPSYGWSHSVPRKSLLILFALSIVAIWSVEREESTLTVRLEFYHLLLEGHRITISYYSFTFALV
jgi:hypothetical protein